MTQSTDSGNSGGAVQPLTLRLSKPLHPPILSPDNGPGRRWLLYVQGCRHPCTPRCLNPELLDSRKGVEQSLEQALLMVDLMAVGRYGPVEGITVLGGEPTDQADALLPLLRHAQEAGLSVMLYSGHPRSWFHLSENAIAKQLLDVTDLLVAEPFVPELADPRLKWRGSSNQVVERLTDRYSEADLVAGMSYRGATVSQTPSGDVIVTGLQTTDREATVPADKKP